MPGPKRVRAVLNELQLLPETVLVIRNDALVTEDELVADADTIEIRPVISGGAGWSGGVCSSIDDDRPFRTPHNAL